MRDPIDELDNFDPGAPMTPLPPSEVRHLGDRHRRRRTAGVALAAAAAVAVVATGSAVLAGGEPGALPPSNPGPSVTTPTPSGPRIPDTVDVTLGMFENDSGEPVTQTHDGLGLTPLDFCGVTPFAGDERADSLSAATSGPEYSDTRELILYADVQQAQRVLDNLTDAAMGCPREQSGPGSTTLHDVSTPEIGEGATVVAATYETDGRRGPGAEILQFIRVGDAVLATSVYSEFNPTDLDPVLAELAEQVAPVVEQMCVFSGEGCATTTEPPTDPPSSEPPSSEPPADTDDIPAGFPLAAGWPTRQEPEGDGTGLTGPTPDFWALEDFEVCDAALPTAASAIDRLGASWTNVEDYRYRQLLSFEDADGAIDYQRQLVDAYRACPRDEDAEGNASLTDVRQTRVGGESWAFVRTYEYQGAPAIGMEVIHVVRLGRALLVDTAANEGGGGPDPDAEATAQITRQTADASVAVSAMCTFTEAGCR